MSEMIEKKSQLESDVMHTLEHVIDPELGIDLVNLGLIYDVTVVDGNCEVKMTLTTMGCPVGDMLDKAITDAVLEVEGINHLNINLVWEPAWDMNMMSRYAKVALGIHE